MDLDGEQRRGRGLLGGVRGGRVGRRLLLREGDVVGRVAGVIPEAVLAVRRQRRAAVRVVRPQRGQGPGGVAGRVEDRVRGVGGPVGVGEVVGSLRARGVGRQAAAPHHRGGEQQQEEEDGQRGAHRHRGGLHHGRQVLGHLQHADHLAGEGIDPRLEPEHGEHHVEVPRPLERLLPVDDHVHLHSQLHAQGHAQLRVDVELGSVQLGVRPAKEERVSVLAQEEAGPKSSLVLPPAGGIQCPIHLYLPKSGLVYINTMEGRKGK